MTLRYVRREHQVLCPAKALANEPHLSIEPLHTVLTTLNILRIFVVNQLSVAYIANEGPGSEVD